MADAEIPLDLNSASGNQIENQSFRRGPLLVGIEQFDDEATERERLQKLEEVWHKIEFCVEKSRNGRVGIIDAFVDIGANALRNSQAGCR